MSSERSVLLTGATGFVGGSVLATLLQSTDEITRNLSVTALVRKQSHADVLKKHNIATIVLEGGLDDLEGLTRLASQQDIVVNTAMGHHASSTRAMIAGLALRKKATGVDPIFIHLSGTTNLSVGNITAAGDCLTFSDKDDGIYEYEAKRNAVQAYTQRTADLTVIESGEEFGVRTFIVMPPTVWGRGTGFFKQSSHQIPLLVRNAVNAKRAEYVADGLSGIGHVHVADLATLFELVLARAVADPALPAGRKGYFFANTGRHTWKEVAERIGKIGYELGVLDSAEAFSIDLTEATPKFADGDEAHIERILASSSSTVVEKGYELGWKPEREQEWEGSIKEAVHMVLDEKAN